jgi:hypothetical protein
VLLAAKKKKKKKKPVELWSYFKGMPGMSGELEWAISLSPHSPSFTVQTLTTLDAKSTQTFIARNLVPRKLSSLAH